jgi:hypothetical protein
MVNAQAETKTLAFKKGEILDILLLNGKPDFKKLFPKYKETVFVFASKTGYQAQPGFPVLEITQGGYQPDTFIFGKWPNITARKKFLNEIETNVPDFHEQRRAMWSTFYMTYYEVKKDISFDINPAKVIVATAYWKNNSNTFANFEKLWFKEVKNKGGKVLLELSNPMSSAGYMYKPDFMALTEWNDRTSFDTFVKTIKKIGEKGIQNVNEFIIR